MDVKKNLYWISLMFCTGLMLIGIGVNDNMFFLFQWGSILILFASPMLVSFLLNIKPMLLRIPDLLTIGTISAVVSVLPTIYFSSVYQFYKQDLIMIPVSIIASTTLVSSFLFILVAHHRKNENDISDSIMR